MNKLLHFAYSLVVITLILSGLTAAYAGFNIWQHTQINQYIESDKTAEQQIPAHYKAYFAAAFDHALNERPQEALDTLTRLVARDDIKADDNGRASSYYNRGNIHLLQAQAMTVGDLKRVPLVELAKQDYRTALLIQPNAWDIRFNLELALRMAPEEPEDNAVFDQPIISSEKSIESVGFRVDLP